MGQPKAPDKVDAAVASVTREMPRYTLALELRSGQQVILTVPASLSPQDAIDIIGAIARDLPAQLLQAALQRGGALEVPGGVHIFPPA